MKVQKEDSPKGLAFMTLAQSYKLGTADRDKITLQTA
jgi:hypothetical protein